MPETRASYAAWTAHDETTVVTHQVLLVRPKEDLEVHDRLERRGLHQEGRSYIPSFGTNVAADGPRHGLGVSAGGMVMVRDTGMKDRLGPLNTMVCQPSQAAMPCQTRSPHASCRRTILTWAPVVTPRLDRTFALLSPSIDVAPCRNIEA